MNLFSMISTMHISHWILNTCTTLLLLYTENVRGCGLPAAIQHGHFIPYKSKYVENDKVMYACNDGFSFYEYKEAVHTILCQKGKWVNDFPPSCVPVKNPTCGRPGTPAFGYFANRPRYLSYSTGMIVKYVCKKGYVLLGNSTRTCSGNGSWRPQEIPKCVTNLAYQKDILQIVQGNAQNMVYDNLTSCYAGVKLNFSPFSELVINLGKIVDFTNIFISTKHMGNEAWILQTANESTSVKDRRTLARLKMYNASAMWFNTSDASGPILSQKTKYIFIQTHLRPSNFEICEFQIFNALEPVDCASPDMPANGFATGWSSSLTGRFNYNCSIGFTPSRTSVLHCLNGEWDNRPPKCIKNQIETTANKPTQTTALFSTMKTEAGEEQNITIMVILIGILTAVVTIVVVVLIVICMMKMNARKNTSEHVSMDLGNGRPKSEDVSEHNYETVIDENYRPKPFSQQPRPPLYSCADSDHYEIPILIRKDPRH